MYWLLFLATFCKNGRAFFLRLVWNMVWKCTQILLNIEFCSPEPKMTSDINIGPDLYSLNQKL